jgi:predicted  nucleic acid-binding Zn-ribbon protein
VQAGASENQPVNPTGRGEAVSDELAILYQVQQVDTELAQLRAALAKLDSGAELKTELAAAENEYKTLLSRHHTAEAESRALELEIATLQEKKAKFESQLYGGTVRNPRQLSDLQDEVAMLDREVTKLEDRELELMETLESQRSQLSSRAADLAEMKQQLETVLSNYAARSATLSEQIAALEPKRKELATGVTASLLKRYEQIRTRQSNLGLVRVKTGSCPGCRVGLASELLKELRTGRVGITCDNCGRLLYWERPVD